MVKAIFYIFSDKRFSKDICVSSTLLFDPQSHVFFVPPDDLLYRLQFFGLAIILSFIGLASFPRFSFTKTPE